MSEATSTRARADSIPGITNAPVLSHMMNPISTNEPSNRVKSPITVPPTGMLPPGILSSPFNSSPGIPRVLDSSVISMLREKDEHVRGLQKELEELRQQRSEWNQQLSSATNSPAVALKSMDTLSASAYVDVKTPTSKIQYEPSNSSLKQQVDEVSRNIFPDAVTEDALLSSSPKLMAAPEVTYTFIYLHT